MPFRLASRSDSVPLLSAREGQVLRLLVADRTRKELAGELGITTKTADATLSHIRQKKGKRTTIGAVLAAVRSGEVPIDQVIVIRRRKGALEYAYHKTDSMTQQKMK